MRKYSIWAAVALTAIMLSLTPRDARAGDPVVEEIQSLLVQKGFDPGPVDGLWGGGTRRALDRYLAREGLTLAGGDAAAQRRDALAKLRGQGGGGDGDGYHAQLQNGHTDTVKSISIDDDGRYMITNAQFGFGVDSINEDSSSKLWDLRTGRLLRNVLKSSDDGLARLSPDGTIIAAFKGKVYHGFDSVEFVDLSGKPVPELAHIDGKPVGNIFSADGATIVTYVPNKHITVWNARTGAVIGRWTPSKGIFGTDFNYVTVSPDHKLATIESLFFPPVIDLTTFKPMEKLNDALDTGMLSTAVFSPTGRYVYAASTLALGSNNPVSVIDVRSTETVATLNRDGDRVEDFDWGAGDDLVGFSFDKADPQIWSVSQDRMLLTIDLNKANPDSDGGRFGGFSHDGVYFIAGRNPAVFRTSDGALVARLPPGVSWASFLPGDDALLAFHRDGAIERIETADWTTEFRFGTGLQPVFQAEWSPDGTRISSVLKVDEDPKPGILSNHLRGRRWDAATGALKLAVDRSGLLAHLAAVHGKTTYDGDDNSSNYFIRLLSPGLDHVVVQYPRRGAFSGVGLLEIGDDGPVGERLALQNPADHYFFEFAYRRQQNQVIGYSERQNVFVIWDMATGDIVRKLEVENGRNKVDYALSPDGRYFVVVAYDYNGDDADFYRWDLGATAAPSDAKPRRIKASVGHFLGAVSNDGKRVWVQEQGWRSSILNLDTGRAIALKMEEERADVDAVYGSPLRAAFSPDDGFLATAGRYGTGFIWDVRTGNLARRLVGHDSGLSSIVWSDDGTRLLTGSDDGTVRLWDAATLTERVKFVSFDDGEWVTITPEGFFAASANGAGHMLLVRDGTRSGGVATEPEVYSIDQVYQALYRPDLVAAAIAGDPDGKVAAAAGRLDLATVLESGSAPGVAITSPLADAAMDDERVEVAVTVTDRGGGVGKVEWRVNGVTLGVETRGLERLKDTAGAPEPRPGATETVRKSLWLDPGRNVIEVVAYNARGLIASEPATVTVTWDGASSTAKPRLYVLAAGVNDYWDGRLQLNYAASDAAAVAGALGKAGGSLYEEVKVTTLLDADVTGAGLERAFATLADEVRPRDVFVFYLAGHGKTEDGRFYFLPQDFRYEDEGSIARTGIGQEAFQRWLAGIAARKSVLLYDTCESGSLTGASTRGLERVAALDRLTRAMGRTVLSAATDDAPALEGYRGHGVFTYALLDALDTADANEDGLIEVTELAGAIDRQVPEISFEAFRQRQIPQMSIVGSSFPVSTRVAALADAPTRGEAISATPTHVVIAPTSVRADPDGGAPAIMELTPGTQVTLIEAGNGWSLVARNGARIGYVADTALAGLQ